MVKLPHSGQASPSKPFSFAVNADPLATPTTVPGRRGGKRRTTVPSADGSGPGSGEFVAPLRPFLGGESVTHVVLPRAVDLEEPECHALLAETEHLDDAPTVAVARHDTDLDAVQVQGVEQIAQHLHRIALLPLPKERADRNIEELAEQIEHRGLDRARHGAITAADDDHRRAALHRLADGGCHLFGIVDRMGGDQLDAADSGLHHAVDGVAAGPADALRIVEPDGIDLLHVLDTACEVLGRLERRRSFGARQVLQSLGGRYGTLRDWLIEWHARRTVHAIARGDAAATTHQVECTFKAIGQAKQRTLVAHMDVQDVRPAGASATSLDELRRIAESLPERQESRGDPEDGDMIALTRRLGAMNSLNRHDDERRTVEELEGRLDALATQVATADADACVRRMFASAFARPPSDAELARAKSYLAELAHEHGGENLSANENAWRDFAQSLFNLKEFIYAR